MKKISPSLCLAILLMTSIALAADADKTVALSDTPAAVQKTITVQVADGKVDEINRTTQDGEIVFAVDYAAKSGDDRDFTVAEDGTLLSVGVELADLPAAVQKTIKAQ